MALIDDLIRSGVANVFAQGTSPPRPPRNIPMPGASMKGVNPRLVDAIQGGATYLPEGYSIRARSGREGRTDPRSHHYGGNAVDVQIVGPNGPIPHKGEDTTGMYTHLARGVKTWTAANDPELGSKIGYGGAFGTKLGGGGVPDLMHYDLGGSRGNMRPQVRFATLKPLSAAEQKAMPAGAAPPQASTVVADAVRQDVKPGETPLPRPRPEPQGKIASTDVKPGRVANIQTDDVPTKGYARTPPARAEAPAQRAIGRAAGPPAGLQAGAAPAGRSQLASDIIKGYGPAGAGLTTYREPGTGREIVTGNVEGNSIMRDLGRTQPMASAAPRAVKSAAAAAPAAPPSGMTPITAPEGVPLPRPRPAGAPAVAPPGPSATDFPAVGFELGERPRAGTPDINAPDFNFQLGAGKVDPIAENRARLGLYKYGPQGRAERTDPLSGGPMSPKAGDRLLGGPSTSDAPSITPAFADRFDSSTIFSPTAMANQPGPGGALSVAQLRDFLSPLADRFAPAPGSVSSPPPSTPGGGPSPTVGAPMPAYAGPSSLNTPAGPSPSAAMIGTAQAAPLMGQQQLPWWMQQGNAGWWTPSGMWGGEFGSPVSFGGDFAGGGLTGGTLGGW